MDKLLIISPHLDDEVYGCASFLKDGKNVTIVYVTTYHSKFPGGDNVRENQELVKELGVYAIYLKNEFQTNNLDLLGHANLITQFETIINEIEPHTVLIPFPSYNQDHRIIYDSALTAMRPHDRNFFVKRILVYEQPETFGTIRNTAPLMPTYYRELDIDFKLKLMRVYKSQMRGHRTLDHVATIARLRGMQVNVDYAEAFEVLRWMDGGSHV